MASIDEDSLAPTAADGEPSARQAAPAPPGRPPLPDAVAPGFDKLPGDMDYLEYPVLTGLFMEVASW
ncbi:hypothetical protein AB0N19_08660, partial [Streptomyces sp. NPDC051132]|uniref:hypothetical protein n=1 Tax=Streptomyces sp. NPDC051132 TaxID=3155667 RepID=UPI003421AA75